jgi:hypothetical protein
LLIPRLSFLFSSHALCRFASNEKKESFAELVEYQRVHGTTVVPQVYPQLGTWVHSQRKHYKWRMEGKRSPMTDAQASKLRDSGFVFVVKARRPTGNRTKNNLQVMQGGHARRRHDYPNEMEESSHEDEGDDDNASFEG